MRTSLILTDMSGKYSKHPATKWRPPENYPCRNYGQQRPVRAVMRRSGGALTRPESTLTGLTARVAGCAGALGARLTPASRFGRPHGRGTLWMCSRPGAAAKAHHW